MVERVSVQTCFREVNMFCLINSGYFKEEVANVVFSLLSGPDFGRIALRPFSAFQRSVESMLFPKASI